MRVPVASVGVHVGAEEANPLPLVKGECLEVGRDLVVSGFVKDANGGTLVWRGRMTRRRLTKKSELTAVMAIKGISAGKNGLCRMHREHRNMEKIYRKY